MLKVKKRKGAIVEFDREKIRIAISKCLEATDMGGASKAQSLTDKVVHRIKKRWSDDVIEVEQIQDQVEEILEEEEPEKVVEAYRTYREKRTEIREAKWWLLNHSFKTKLTPNALEVLSARYLKKNQDGKIIETPQELFKRVSQNIASADKIYNTSLTREDLFKTEEEFFRMMASLEFLPNSPTLMNAGNVLQQLSACFVLPVPDSMDGIFTAIKDAALIHQSGGGTGFSFNRLRPKGDIVRSTKGVASGPVSFMTVFDSATEVIKQGGKRRGANMGILRIDHPDILRFVDAKLKEGKLSNFNISVAITDEFIKKVEEGGKYDLVNPRTNQTQGQLDAQEVFNKIVRYAWATGDPGLIFIDKINRENPTPHLGEIESTNPCGEQPLLPYESCNLGSINLSKMIEGGEIDWDKLRDVVHKAVHFLDNVIDVNRYPLSEIERMTKGNRKIGLGVMGFADMLIKLGVRYGSRKALKLAKKVMTFVNEEAEKASVDLAKIRGVFPNFRNSVYDQDGAPRVRNATRTTIAPTGTISIIAGCSSGIEPLFTIAFVRDHNLKEGGGKMTQINAAFEDVARQEGFYSKELIDNVLGKKSVKDVESIPKKFRDVLVTTFDVSPEEHVLTQAAFQKHTDNAVSKTINFPFEASEEEVSEAYLLAFKKDCKGITIFRNGSRNQQVLNLKDEKGEPVTNQEVDSGPRDKDPMPTLDPQEGSKCSSCQI